MPTYKGVQSAAGLFYVATMTVAAFVVLATMVRLVWWACSMAQGAGSISTNLK